MFAEKTAGQAVVFQGGEKQQPGHSRIFSPAAQDVFRDGGEYLLVGSVGLEGGGQVATHTSSLAFAIDDGPVQVFFAGKMTKDERFVHACPRRDLAGGGPVEALMGEKFCGQLHDLLATILGGESELSSSHG